MSEKTETIMKIATIISDEFLEPVSDTLIEYVATLTKIKNEAEFKRILDVSPSVYVSFGLAVLTKMALSGKIILVRKDGSYGFSKQTTDCDTQKRSAV